MSHRTHGNKEARKPKKVAPARDAQSDTHPDATPGMPGMPGTSGTPAKAAPGNGGRHLPKEGPARGRTGR